MNVEMPRDTTLVKLRDPVISKLDLMQANAPEIRELLRENKSDAVRFTLNVGSIEIAFHREELEIGLAYLSISKQL